MHSPATFGKPARVVYTRRCPEGRIGRTRGSAAVDSQSRLPAGSPSLSELETRIAPAAPEVR